MRNFANALTVLALVIFLHVLVTGCQPLKTAAVKVSNLKEKYCAMSEERRIANRAAIKRLLDIDGEINCDDN